MADYLLPDNILKLEEQRDIFKIRPRTNILPSNWGEHTLCETGCLEILDNEHILKCLILKENETFYIYFIFNGKIEEKLEVLIIFKTVVKLENLN